MSAYVKVTTPSLRLLTPQQRGEVLRRVRAGEYGGQIARATGVARSTVKAIAKQAGLALSPAVRMNPEQLARLRAERKAHPMTVTAAADPLLAHWRGQAWSARWGAKLGA